VTDLGDRFPAILERAAAGDQDAFAQLWSATHPMLVRYLRVMCAGQAEDVASETWLKAIRALGSFHGDEQGFRGWLVVIARNVVRDLARHQARRPETLSGDLPPDYVDREALRPVGPEPDAADVALERLSTRAALRLVAGLPPAQAEMVALRVVIGLDVAEVAAIVGRSPGAVRVAVHRGLRALADQLADQPPPVLETGPEEASVTQEQAKALSNRDV
jgi:RNA polymerase sigma-70 factor (ECF subfamily)